MSRKLPAFLFGLVLAVLAATPAVAQAPAPKREPVQLRLSWWGGNDVHRAMLASARAFERAHPGITVKTEYTGWAGHLERITTQIAGDTAPDVMQINWNWLVLFSRNGQGFYDLERLGGQIDLTQFDTESLAMGRVNGRLNAIPVSMAARLLYYNETTFAKAGLPLPRTWDELIAAGPVFRKKLGPAYYPIDLTLQDVVALTRSELVQRTGKPLIDDKAKRLTVSARDLADMLRFYQRLVDAHVTPDARTQASFGNVAQHEMRPWINGQFAGTYQWLSSIGKLDDTLAPGQELRLGSYPMYPGARDAGLLYRPAMMLVVNAKTEHPKESALLLDFLLNDPASVSAMGLKRGLPVSDKAVAQLLRAGVPGGLAVEGMSQVEALPHAVHESPYFEHARVRDAFIDTFELYAYGAIDADSAGQRLHEDVNRILARVIR